MWKGVTSLLGVDIASAQARYNTTGRTFIKQDSEYMKQKKRKSFLFKAAIPSLLVTANVSR